MKKNVLFLSIGLLISLLVLIFVRVPVQYYEFDLNVKDTSIIIGQSNVTATPINGSKLVKVKSTTIEDFDGWLRKNAKNIDYTANRTLLKTLHTVDASGYKIIDSNLIKKIYKKTDIENIIKSEMYGEYLSIDTKDNIVKNTSLVQNTAQLSAPAVYAIFDGYTDNDKIEFAKYTNNNIPQIGIKITKSNGSIPDYFNFSTDPTKPPTVFAIPIYEYLFSKF